MLNHRLLSMMLACLLMPTFPAMAANDSAEFNPAFRAANTRSIPEARVIIKWRQDSTLLRKHALSVALTSQQAVAILTARTQALGQRHSMTGLLRSGRALDERSHVVHATGIDSDALAQRLKQDPEVEYAVVDARRSRLMVPNDPLYLQGPPIGRASGGPVAGQWYLRSPAGDVISSINATGAWDVTTGSASVVVAVLDTGVRPEHPDLQGRLLPGYDMIDDLPTANNGGVGRRADASDPGDWVTHTEANDVAGTFYECDVGNSSWHGTLTASLVGAAGNNGAGMAGVTWGAMILPVRVLGKCGGFDSDILAGMRWAAGLEVPGLPLNLHPARILNLSLGSDGECTRSYQDVIDELGNKSSPAVVIAAAGNSTGRAVGTPARCAGVIAVAGLRHAGTKVGFSDLGPEITISAPAGNCVNLAADGPCLYAMLAATNTGTTSPLASAYSDAFQASVGTSFSAPLVSGTVALMLSQDPTLPLADIRNILRETARPFPQALAGNGVPQCLAPSAAEQLECHCSAQTCGAGMLDAAAAVKTVAARMTEPLPLVTGWNLTGSGLNAPAEVAKVFADIANVESVWKWVGATQRWAMYAPAMTQQELATYALSKSYDVLSTLDAGEGFWVHAKQAFTATMPKAEAVLASQIAGRLHKGWNLIAIGTPDTPQQLRATLGSAAPFESLWAWDSSGGNWFFYAPSLEALGGAALLDYTKAEGYRDFSSSAKTLGSGVGVWVKLP